MNMVSLEKNAQYEFDLEHNVIRLICHGTIKHYDAEKPRLKMFGQDAINIDMNLLLDIRDCSSVLSHLDLFHVSADLQYLISQGRSFKVAVIVDKQEHYGMVKKLQQFVKHGESFICPFMNETSAHQWLNGATLVAL